MGDRRDPVCLRLHPQDNVVVALERVGRGQAVLREPAPGGEVRALEEVRPGHKLAVRWIKAGENVIKYGCPIGRAIRDIRPGEWVHEHNLATALEEGVGRYVYRPSHASYLPPEKPAFFHGYRRADGSVGTRNEVWILPTVSCVNRNAELIARRAEALLPHFPRVEGVYAFPHAQECSQGRTSQEPFRRMLANLANHPSAGGVLVLSLGCEVNHPDTVKPYLKDYDPARVKFLMAQEVEDDIEVGVRVVKELLSCADRFAREPVPAAELRVGLKCGGSDAFSGITANPLVGAVTDRLASAGGTAVLTEIPELFGAEQHLMNRAADEQVFSALVEMVEGFKRYFSRLGLPVYGKDNPSPGNKEGGITTLEEKALGGLHKSGTAPVTDVLGYGETLRRPGVNLLSCVADDITSITALAACGCNLILFTTGRGTPVGSCVPTLKIASRSELYAAKPAWLDFDAGRLAAGEPVEALAEELLGLILEVASGRRTRCEVGGFREVAFQQDWL